MKNKDIRLLISNWFSALEDEGTEPWAIEECIEMANKYCYTEEDYEGVYRIMEENKNRFFELFSKYFFDLWD